MACGGCDTQTGMTKEQVENLVNKLIDDGKISGGLKSCDGGAVSPGTKVVLCDALTKAINDAIKSGDVDVVKDVALSGDKVVVTKGDGKTKELSLPFAKATAGEDEVVLTLPDGSTVAVPKSGAALTEKDFDNTIKKGVNEADKFGVNLQDKGGLDYDNKGAIFVKTGGGLTKDANGNVVLKPGDGVKIDDKGNVTIDSKTVGKLIADALAGSGLVAENGQLKVATVRLMDASGTVPLGNLVDTSK